MRFSIAFAVMVFANSIMDGERLASAIVAFVASSMVNKVLSIMD